MKKIFIFVRHAAENKQAILDSLARVIPLSEGKTVKIAASKQAEVDSTVRAFEDALKVVSIRTSTLAGTPQDQNFDAVIEIGETLSAQVVIFITHADFSANLPHAFGLHYKLINIPPVKYKKPGEFSVMRIPAGKVKLLEDQRLSAMV